MSDQKLPLTIHLDELRKRILAAFFFLAVASAISFYFIEAILHILKVPAGSEIGTLAVFSPTAAVLSFFKIALASGFVFSAPVFLYEIWMFVLPALEKRHARSGLWFIFSGTTLFFIGCFFSYFFLVPASLKFLLQIGKGELQFIISLDSYVSFVLLLVLGGGLIFEMPVLVFVLSRLGVLTPEKMVRGWRVAIVGILITAALVTPTPDLVNLFLISFPMLILYFASIGVSRAAQKEKAVHAKTIMLALMMFLVAATAFSAEPRFHTKEHSGVAKLKDVQPELPDSLGDIAFYGRNRVRYEAWDYFTSAAANDYEFAANQLRLGTWWDHEFFKVHAVWQYSQLSNLPASTSAGSGSGSLYFSNSLDRNSHGQFIKYLHLDVKDSWKTGFTGTAGRFNYSSGNEMKSVDKKLDWLKSQRISDRLVGGFEWSHYGRSFDGAKAAYTNEVGQISAASFSPTQGGFEERAHREIDDIDVIAIEMNIRKDKLIPGMEEQFFYYGYGDYRNIGASTLRFDNTGRVIPAGVESDIEIHTFGGHWVGTYTAGLGVWDVLGWIAVQEGAWFELDHKAYAFAAETGYQFNRCPWKPWLRVGFNYGSGDDDSSDGNHQTFYQMLPTGRLYSFSTLYNLMNNEDLFLSMILKPLENITLRTEYHLVRLAEKNDRWYLGSGAMHTNVADDFASRPSNSLNNLGQLLDVSVSWAVNSDITINGYYGHFFGDDVVERFFTDQRDVNYAYLEAVINF